MPTLKANFSKTHLDIKILQEYFFEANTLSNNLLSIKNFLEGNVFEKSAAEHFLENF